MQTQLKINTGVRTPVKFTSTCAMAAFIMASPIWALNSRSWVSGHGSDQNTCTGTSPCRTFQHAHDMTASGGEVDVLDPADYGTLVITKSITIDGGNLGYIQVPLYGTGIKVNVPSPGSSRVDSSVVILRNLSMAELDGAPNIDATLGVVWSSGGSLSVESMSFNDFESAIQAEYPQAEYLLVKDTTIKNCQYGIEGGSAAMSAVLEHVTMQSVGYGVDLTFGKATITHSVISNASSAAIRAGYALDQTGPVINVEDSTIVYSAVGLDVAFGTIRIAGDNIHDNAVGMQFIANQGQIVSFGNNRIQGNGSGETPTSTVTLK